MKQHNIDISLKKFEFIDGDMDYKHYQRVFTGKLTKARYKALNRLARKLTYHTHCGHEWDCCGCLCGQGAGFTYKHNQVVFSISQSFNY